MKNINELPRIDCDVFVADDSFLCIGDFIKITGNFYAGENCSFFGEIDAKEGVYIDDYSTASSIHSEGPVVIGDFANVDRIETTDNVYLGDYSTGFIISAGGDVFCGYASESFDCTAYGDIVENKKIPWKKLFKRFRSLFRET